MKSTWMGDKKAFLENLEENLIGFLMENFGEEVKEAE